ncbi:uncharacterized protein LOC119689788 [Teleopsis dalmanni]|uniref:uncharacterized protein LOC119689788 n=1 Tax=Teleopsis dalmanni TaxID=139649 RepID=UPI0018CF3C31|nr:uncharacterized protein LOC119689788 [Teleopsis dalmanni]
MEPKFVVGKYTEKEMEAAMALLELHERVYLDDPRGSRVEKPTVQTSPIDFTLAKTKTKVVEERKQYHVSVIRPNIMINQKPADTAELFGAPQLKEEQVSGDNAQVNAGMKKSGAAREKTVVILNPRS